MKIFCLHRQTHSIWNSGKIDDIVQLYSDRYGMDYLPHKFLSRPYLWNVSYVRGYPFRNSRKKLRSGHKKESLSRTIGVRITYRFIISNIEPRPRLYATHHWIGVFFHNTHYRRRIIFDKGGKLEVMPHYVSRRGKETNIVPSLPSNFIAEELFCAWLNFEK